MDERKIYLFADIETVEGDKALKMLHVAGIEVEFEHAEGLAPRIVRLPRRVGEDPTEDIQGFIELFLKEKEELREARTTFEEREVRRKNAQKYLEELYRQLERIFDVEKGYLFYTGKDKKQFMEDYITPLTEAIHAARNLPDFDKVKLAGNMPLVLVLPRQIVPLGAQAHRVEIDGENGDPFPFVSARFNNVVTMKNAHPFPYLIVDVNDGKFMLNVTPRKAAATLKITSREPFNLEEGLGFLTHFPESLKNMRMLLGVVEVEGQEVTPFFYADSRVMTFSVIQGVESTDMFGGTASYGMRILPEEIVEAISAVNDQGGGGTFCSGCSYAFENGSAEQMRKLMEDRLGGQMNRCPGCKKRVRFVGL